MTDLPDGWFFDEDIAAYRALAERVPENGTIIELGVWKGRSLCSIADIVKKKNLTVYAVDTFKGTDGEELYHMEAKNLNIQQEFLDNMAKFGIKAKLFAMTTDDASKCIPMNVKFDMMLLDADHSFEAVTKDIENWLPKCKGIIAGHDIERPEVAKAVGNVFPSVKHRGLVWWNDFNEVVSTGKKIDVIIPAYKAQDTIGRTLASIAMQSIADRVTVTIANDADGIGYENFVEKFADMLDIKEVTLPVNGGPGVARQYGIDHSELPYFTCIDADDTFAGAFALEILLKGMEDNPEYHTVIGSFAEHHLPLTFVMHQNDLVWMFGKLYTRAFIEKYGIRFNETRANEDNGFNTIVRLVSSETEKIMFLPDVVYYWHHREDSITRINNTQYSYDQSFVGYTDNMIYAVKHAKKMKPFNGYIDMWAIQVMAQLYNYYYQTVKRDNRFVDQNYSCCLKYFREVFGEIYDKMDKKVFDDIFAQTLSEQAPNMRDNVPDKTIYQFIEQLKSEPPAIAINGIE
jgi:glycosyltransferase involved in cell wall biosynthesis